MKRFGVIFVCLGNICRSPMAKGLFQARILDRGLEASFDVDSAGTSSYHIGEPPDPGSIRVAREAGIDLSGDRARQFTAQDLERFDFVIALDRANQRDMRRLSRQNHDKIHLLRSFETDPSSPDVPDPWGGGLDSFQRAFRIVEAATDGLLEHILDNNLHR